MSDKMTFVLKTIAIILVVIVSILFYSRYIGTSGLKIKEYGIESNYIPEHADGLKIVHFTDLHYGSTILKKELTNLVKRINDQKPDIVVFTGDLIENKVVLSDEDLDFVVETLGNIKPKIEVLSVKGNHDYDHDYYDEIMARLNWINLNNTYEYVYTNGNTPIIFVGLNDLTRGKVDYANAFSFLNESNEKYYTIVLTHEPDSVTNFKNYDFDLVLAGHSHLGQVRIPFLGAIFTPVGSKLYYDSYYEIDNYKMYISGGIGTSLVKMRLFNRPSFNLYRLYKNTN